MCTAGKCPKGNTSGPLVVNDSSATRTYCASGECFDTFLKFLDEGYQTYNKKFDGVGACSFCGNDDGFAYLFLKGSKVTICWRINCQKKMRGWVEEQLQEHLEVK